MRRSDRVVVALLHSRLHGFLSRSVLVLHYTGRRTGQPRRLPVQYACTESGIVLVPGRFQQKRWWRNFADPQPVHVRLRDRTYSATARTAVGEDARPFLHAYAARWPRMSATVPGQPIVIVNDISRAAVPDPTLGTGPGSAGVLACLAVSAAALALAPLLIAHDYSWVQHTISDSAAQGVEGGWVARTGFVLFAVAVAAVAAQSHQRWGVLRGLPHYLFALGMCTAAVFSTRHWDHATAFNVTQDRLHSVATSTVGFGIVVGVLAVASLKGRPMRRRSMDGVVVATAILVPLIMFRFEYVAGAAQRGMFAMAFIWYAGEALWSAPAARTKRRPQRRWSPRPTARGRAPS